MIRKKPLDLKHLRLPLANPAPVRLPIDKQQELELALTELLLEAAGSVEQIEEEGAENAF